LRRIDFELTPEQSAFRNEVAAFAQGALGGDAPGSDEAGGFPREGWRKCAEFGIHGLPIPAEYGGLGADAISIVLALEALGYGCRDNGLLFSVNAQLWACVRPIVRFGTEEQKARYLPGLGDGSIVAGHAMSEPGSGSDAFALSTTATASGDFYVLNGSKTFVTNAPVADLLVVFATTDRNRGFAGLCAFLVPRDAPGLSIGQPLHKMGLRTSPMSEVFFDDCEVSADQMLGQPGAGMAIFNSSMEWERGCILACTVGTMQRQLERCIAYARERRQFDQPIGKFQAVSHRIADMKVRLEAARLVAYRMAWLLDQGRSTPLDSALTKLYLSESFVQSSMDAVAVHGGYGYMAEYELERELRDAIGSRIYSGTSDLQRNIIAHHLSL
jgi:alkylation response protein AidB-like acyl-CoA dehydrogenase